MEEREAKGFVNVNGHAAVWWWGKEEVSQEKKDKNSIFGKTKKNE